ncbi:sugar ABC transporter substrate-binding protein [Anaerorhabdus sp.]|uniref:sugar ABC transporter substrate-binding protein n=1 Tax=Anaerorhabdus sp. TaxID=1872524 RepID=UPI002FCA8678
MKKKIVLLLICLLTISSLVGCSKKEEKINIGVSFGVGEATRWQKEKTYMEEKAAELGVNIEVRLNRTDTPLTQTEDCIEMIDQGIDVLILTPRDVTNVEEIISYAKEKNVPVISYSRTVLNQYVDLVVGYDSYRLGQTMGQYLSESVYTGDYIILKGDPSDSNAQLTYDGAMRYIDPMRDDINIILEEAVPGWSRELAKEMVIEAIQNNGGNVDAILAPNDKIAGGCAEAVKELGIDHHVVITGMDAELDAIQRIINNEQDMTISLDLQMLASTAIEEAVLLASGKKPKVNTEVSNGYSTPVPGYLITGIEIVKQNINSEIIEKGFYTTEEVYGN